MSMKIDNLVDKIMELDEVERIEFIDRMKNTIQSWKERCESELRWMEQLERMGFKKEKSDIKNDKIDRMTKKMMDLESFGGF